MTLEEAIEHAREVADTCENSECAQDHAQLADWLSELKAYRDFDDTIIVGDAKPCSMCGKPARCIDICSEGHFCSQQCLREFYNWFNEWANAPIDLPEEDEDPFWVAVPDTGV